MRYSFILILSLVLNGVFAQGSFAPAVGTSGTKAIYKDSIIIKSWASECIVSRGFIDVANKNLGQVNFGKTEYAIGKSDPRAISLGDSGIATTSFSGVVFNGTGADFCVFENSFNNDFLELAFVEVSSDGINFFRFPSFSETDTNSQIGSFDLLEASELHNLAGKYKGQYGTPFDLQEMENIVGLNSDSITHIRIVDVIGSIDLAHSSRDSKGRLINDPYPTDFKNGEWYTGGFDLEAVGLINYKGEIFLYDPYIQNPVFNYRVYPNPFSSNLNVLGVPEKANIRILNLSGTEIIKGKLNNQELNLEELEPGIYFLEIAVNSDISRQKIVKL